MSELIHVKRTHYIKQLTQHTVRCTRIINNMRSILNRLTVYVVLKHIICSIEDDDEDEGELGDELGEWMKRRKKGIWGDSQ